MLRQQLLQRPYRPEGGEVLHLLALAPPGLDGGVGRGEMPGREVATDRSTALFGDALGDPAAERLLTGENSFELI